MSSVPDSLQFGSGKLQDMTHDEGAAGAVDHNMDESRKGASGFGSFLEMFQDASTDKSDIER